MEDAKSGDTIELLKKQIYTLYKVFDTPVLKTLTFVGQGPETIWTIGSTPPDPHNFGTEYNGDYSFDGADTITFKNMTLQSGTVDYLGFIRINNTIVEDCVVNGKTFYWGYKKASFINTIFNAPNRDYALWTYCSPIMNFTKCTFNSSGKTINVYTDFSANKHDITINVQDCTVNSSSNGGPFTKPVLNINDSNMGNFKYHINLINLKDTNTINGEVVRDTAKPSNYPDHTATCSRWFGFGLKQNKNNKGRTVVTIDGTTVFENGKMISHELIPGKYTDGYVDNAYTTTEWTPEGNQFKREKICDYCKYKVDEKGYQLTYDPAGGEWPDGKSDKKSEEIMPLSKASTIIDGPTRKGYAFQGWQLAGSPAVYQAGASYAEKNTAGEFINGELQAMWKPLPTEPEDDHPVVWNPNYDNPVPVTPMTMPVIVQNVPEKPLQVEVQNLPRTGAAADPSLFAGLFGLVGIALLSLSISKRR